MKYCIGTKITEISKIKKYMRNATFTDRVFTEKERSFFSTQGHKEIPTVAGMFCAKAACMKAISSVVASPAYSEIEILHKKNGRPYIKFHGRLEPLNERLRTDVSISHCDAFATATVIVVKRTPKDGTKTNG